MKAMSLPPSKSNSAEINCHPSVWKRLVAIDARRDTAKNRHQDQLKLKRDLEAELARVGKKPSKGRSKLCEAHWDCLCAIKYELNRQRTLADLMGEAIKKGIQGELFAADDEDLDAEIERAMAGGDEDEGDQEDAATRATAPIDYEAAIGRPRKPEAPAAETPAVTAGAGDDVPRCAICEHPLRGSGGRERVELAPGPGGKPRYGLACTACSAVRRKSEA